VAGWRGGCRMLWARGRGYAGGANERSRWWYWMRRRRTDW